MGRRLDLQSLLKETIGNENVYFQPPSNIKMSYPALVYSLDDMDSQFANNSPYSIKNRWKLTYMDLDPDSDKPSKLIMLPGCSFDRHFVADDLNQYVFNIYF